MRNQLQSVVLVLLLSCGGEPGPASVGGGGGATAAGAGAGATGGGSGALGGDAGAPGGGGGGTTSASEQELVAGTRLKVRTVVGADGSRQQLGFFDSQLNEPCFFYAATDGTQRCFPSVTLSSGAWFEDASCSQPLAFAPAGSCTSAPASLRYALSPNIECGNYQYVIRGVGSSFTGSMVYVKSGAACVSQAAPPGYLIYRTTAVVPPSTFVQGNVIVEP